MVVLELEDGTTLLFRYAPFSSFFFPPWNPAHFFRFNTVTIKLVGQQAQKLLE